MREGKQRKRQIKVTTTQEHNDSEIAKLDSRVNFDVPMDACKLGSWEAGDIITSSQFSACTFVAIYDRDQYFAAHIPPGSFQQADLPERSAIAAYLSKINGALRKSPLSGTKAGYVFHRTNLPTEDLKAIRDMFTAQGIVPRVKSYTFQEGTSGYRIEVSRKLEQLTFGPAITETLMP